MAEWLGYIPFANVALNLLSLMVAAIILPVLRHVRRLRENELAHIEEALRELKGAVHEMEDDLLKRLDRFEARLDEHLTWHLRDR